MKQDSEQDFFFFLPSKIIGEKVLLILPICNILCMQLHTNNTFPFQLVLKINRPHRVTSILKNLMLSAIL